MTRLSRAIHAFWTILNGKNHPYADGHICFLIGRKDDICKNITDISTLATDEIHKNNLLYEAKEILNA